MLVIKAFCTAAGIDPQDLATECGISANYMRQILTGAMRPSKRVRDALSQRFGVPADQLFQAVDPESLIRKE